MPGRSLALVAMLTDSGHNFSMSSTGPHMDLFWPMKDFLAVKKEEKYESHFCTLFITHKYIYICLKCHLHGPYYLSGHV